MSVCLSRILGLSREQRGLGRLNLAHSYPTSHVTRTLFSRSKGQGHRGRGHIVAASRTACFGLVWWNNISLCATCSLLRREMFQLPWNLSRSYPVYSVGHRKWTHPHSIIHWMDCCLSSASQCGHRPASPLALWVYIFSHVYTKVKVR